MGTCLVTKLKDIVNDENLSKVNELAIYFDKIDSPSATSQKIQVAFTDKGDARISNGNFFTDSMLTNNKGDKISFVDGSLFDVYVNNSKSTLFFSNKYNLKQLFFPANEGITFDVSQLKYSKDFTTLALYYANIQNVNDLKNIPSLYIFKYSGNTAFDIAILKDIKLIELNVFHSKNVTGDVKNIPSTMKWLTLTGTKIYGEFIPDNYPSLVSFENVFAQNSVYGDISKLKEGNFVSMSYNTSKFTWTTERNSSYKILAIEGYPNFGDQVDAMLINQATCVKGFDDSDPAYKKTITALGTRTSASDSAIETLQSKGYTVSITPA